METLPQNLKYLCADKRSVAEVCREIRINQQQFSKYLSGRSKPSPYNLRRIASYFGIEETVLTGSFDSLAAVYNPDANRPGSAIKDPFFENFPGDLENLRQYLGAYQVFFRAPVDPSGVVVNAVFLDERNREIRSRLIEALPTSDSTTRRWTRCDGQVTFQNGRLYVVDCERSQEKALSMYILAKPPRQQIKYLFGSMCFLASVPQRHPHASKVVWKKFDTYKSARQLLRTCGVYSLDSRKIDPKVSRFLRSE